VLLTSRSPVLRSFAGYLAFWVLAVGLAQGKDKAPRAEMVAPSPGIPDANPGSTLPAGLFGDDPAAVDPLAGDGLHRFPLAGPDTIASSALMIDARTGQVLYSKEPDVKRPVASTQKLLTALLVIEHGDLDRGVRVTSEDCRVEPTKLGFKPGEVYSRRQLLAAMLVHSCNDAALCLARADAGSLFEFARKMNAKATMLGASESHFVNPNGLPMPGQYSTARNMAQIAYAAYRNSTLRGFVRMPGLVFTYASGRQRYLEATNRLLLRSTMFTGMKTGYTEASGRCLVSSAANGGREVILVQLGGTHHPLFNDAERLLLWGLETRGNFAQRDGGENQYYHQGSDQGYDGRSSDLIVPLRSKGKDP